MQAHLQLLQQGGGADPHGVIRAHIGGHQQQMQMKAQAQAMAQQGGPQGPPGGGPKPGASPAGPHAVKGPPGQIHPDRMAHAGVVQMPRKM